MLTAASSLVRLKTYTPLLAWAPGKEPPAYAFHLGVLPTIGVQVNLGGLNATLASIGVSSDASAAPNALQCVLTVVSSSGSGLNSEQKWTLFKTNCTLNCEVSCLVDPSTGLCIFDTVLQLQEPQPGKEVPLQVSCSLLGFSYAFPSQRLTYEF